MVNGTGGRAAAGFLKQTFMSKQKIQIDMIKTEGRTAICNMYTGERCVRIMMLISDYNDLIRDGFFIRDGAGKDSAGVYNTTHEYFPDIPKQEETVDDMEGCGALAE